MTSYNLTKDSTGIPVQASSNFTYEDNSASPLTSPQTITQATSFVAPANALFFVVRSTVGNFEYGNIAGYASGYDLAIAGEITAIPCDGGATIVLTPVSGSAVLYYHFECANATN